MRKVVNDQCNRSRVSDMEKNAVIWEGSLERRMENTIGQMSLPLVYDALSGQKNISVCLLHTSSFAYKFFISNEDLVLMSLF